MPDLPHGWRMRNSTVELVGPPIEDNGNSDDDVSDQLDIKPDSEGWEDVEDDVETVSIKCLICTDTFRAARPMVDHCKAAHDFDFVKIQKDHKLDFYGSIKLVNYIRKSTSAGITMPPTMDGTVWAGDEFLAPSIEDDAFLFSLDELDDASAVEAVDASSS